MAIKAARMNATLLSSSRHLVQTKQSPFYIQLRDQVLDSLMGEGKPGDRVPSERQLAKQFETSTVTIARILQEFQENGLLMRVPGKGTFICDTAVSKSGDAGDSGSGAGTGAPFLPNQVLPGRAVAQPLRHTCIVISVSSDPEFLTREYWAHRLISTVERRLQQQGVKTTLIDRKQFEAGEPVDTLNRLLLDGVDSLLYQGEGGMWNDIPKLQFNWDRTMLQLKEKSEARLVIAQVDFSGRSKSPFDSISFSGVRGSLLATRHLLDIGHTDICFLTRSVDFPWIQERIEGFWQALALAGVSTEEEAFTPNGGGRVYCSARPPEGVDEWNWAAQDVVQRFFEHGEAHNRYTAVVALNDQVASAFIQEAIRRGFRVPEDFSVVGFDDRLESKSIGLTTIHLPIEEIGEAAVALMLQRNNEPFESGKVDMVLNPSLVVRSTTLQRVQPTN